MFIICQYIFYYLLIFWMWGAKEIVLIKQLNTVNKTFISLIKARFNNAVIPILPFGVSYYNYIDIL